MNKENATRLDAEFVQMSDIGDISVYVRNDNG